MLQWFGRDPALAESAVRRNNQERFPAHRRNDRDVRWLREDECAGGTEEGIPGSSARSRHADRELVKASAAKFVP